MSIKKKSFGISSTLFPEPTFEDWKQVFEAGYDCVELSIQAHNNFSRAEEYLIPGEKMVHDIKKTGLAIWSLHIPFGQKWNIASLDDIERQRVVREIITLLKQSKHWGYKVAVIHGSAEPVDDNEREKSLEQSKLSIREIGKYSQENDINLALECLPRSCLGNTIEEIKYLIEGTKVKVCFDVNHLLKETHDDFINQISNMIITTHLSDYDGIDECHWIPGMGKINWKELYSGFDKIGYTGPFLFEVSRRLSPDGTKPTPEKILEAFRKAIIS